MFRSCASSTKMATASRKKEPKAGKAKLAPAKEASTPRAESKGAKIVELIGRPKRASLARSQDRVHEDRGGRSHISNQELGMLD